MQQILNQKEPPLSDSERDCLIYRLRDLEREYGRTESDLRMLDMRSRRLQSACAGTVRTRSSAHQNGDAELDAQFNRSAISSTDFATSPIRRLRSIAMRRSV